MYNGRIVWGSPTLFFQDGLFDSNYEFSELGKIWVLWHPSVNVTILSKSLQMITCSVKLPRVQAEFVVSFVYAANDEQARREVWYEVASLATHSAIANKPWAVLGDFNQILNNREHSTAEETSLSRGMRQLNDCLITSNLDDLTFCGNTYTWWNYRAAEPIAKKLDRVLVNEDCSVLVPESYGYFGKPDFSDHSPQQGLFSILLCNIKKKHHSNFRICFFKTKSSSL